VRDRRGNSGAVEEEVGLLPEDEKWLVHIIDVSVNSNYGAIWKGSHAC
jgi:hypothetical protein